jgi:phosphoserine phosphatase RsbU/P
MSTTSAQRLNLHHLLSPEQATEVLSSFVRLAPQTGFALIQPDAHVFAQVGDWSDVALTRVLLETKDLDWTHANAGGATQFDTFRLFPLRAGEHVIGALAVTNANAQPEIDRALCGTLNLLLAESLENRELTTEALERYRELNLLYRVSATIGRTLDPAAIPQQILDETNRAVQAQVALVALLNQSEWEMQATFAKDGGTPTLDEAIRRALDQVEQSGQSMIVADDVLSLSGFDRSSMLCAPLKGRERVIGAVVLLRNPALPVFTASDEKLVNAIATEAAITIENARLHQAELEEERLEHELHLAHQVQATLLPQALPQIAGWDFAALWQPAHEMAGDFYDFIPMGGALGVVIADVTDKGMPAAMFMADTRSVVRASTTAVQSPAMALTHANRWLSADSTDSMFVTLFYARFDLASGAVTYVNGGHNPPMLFVGDEAKPRELTRTGIMLGFDESWQYDERQLHLEPGDLLVLYTDGVTEAKNASNEEFGEARLKELARTHRAESADAILRVIQQSLREFIDEGAQNDDVTIVIVKRQ